MSVVEGVHLALDRLFLAHQDALVLGDLARARTHLARYRRGLERHIEDEEQLLLPRYDPAAHPRRWQADVFIAEHRKLLELLTDLEARLGVADPESELWPRQLVVLIETEGRLKGVVEHHHQREELALFPTLAATLGDEVWAELQARCVFEP